MEARALVESFLGQALAGDLDGCAALCTDDGWTVGRRLARGLARNGGEPHVTAQVDDPPRTVVSVMWKGALHVLVEERIVGVTKVAEHAAGWVHGQLPAVLSWDACPASDTHRAWADGLLARLGDDLLAQAHVRPGFRALAHLVGRVQDGWIPAIGRVHSLDDRGAVEVVLTRADARESWWLYLRGDDCVNGGSYASFEILLESA